MMQQINLYQPIFRKEQKIFSAQTLLVGNLLVLLGIIALYGATYWQGQTLQSQLTQTIQQRDESRNRVNQLAKEYPEKTRDPRLVVKIENSRARLNFLKKVSTTLSSRVNGVEGGFSEYLASLSRQDTPKLWLEQVTILNGGSEIRLRGLTTQSERVPHYIQRLSNESVFQGTSFHRLSIGRQISDKEESTLIQFTLETALETTSKAASGSNQGAPKRWNVKSPGQILDERMR